VSCLECSTKKGTDALRDLRIECGEQMSDSQRYDALVVGGGKGGKTLAMYLGKQNYKVAMIERDPMMG